MKTKKKDTFVLAYEKFCPSPKTEELQQKIYKAQNCRIELELHTRDLVDQKLLANNAKRPKVLRCSSCAMVGMVLVALDLF